MRQLRTTVDAWWRRSAGLPGQLVGVLLIAVPVLVGPLPLTGAGRLAAGSAAATLGAVGALALFGGLAVRLGWVGPDGDRPLARDRFLLLLVVATAGLLVGTAGFLVARAVTHGWAEHLPAAVLFGLPGLALGSIAWQQRRTVEPTGPRDHEP